MALPERRDRARRRRSCSARLRRRAEPRRRARGGSTGASRRRCSCAARPRRAGRLDGPGVLRLLATRSTSRSASRDAGWHSLYVPGGGGDPPRAALDRRAAARGGSSSSRAGATATCASTTAALAAARGARADGVDLRAAGARRARAARPRPARATARTPPRRCAPVARRGAAPRRPSATTPAHRARLSTLAARGVRPAERRCADDPRSASAPSRSSSAPAEEADRAQQRARSRTTRAPRRMNPTAPAVGSSSSPATETATEHGDEPRRGAPLEARPRRAAASAGGSRRSSPRRRSRARSPAPAMPSGGTSTNRRDDVDRQPDERGRQVAPRAPRAARDHDEDQVEAVERPAEREPRQRDVRAEVAWCSSSRTAQRPSSATPATTIPVAST